MTWHSLPLFVRLQGRPVILLGEGEAADAKRRLLDRAGAQVVTDHPDARLAIVAIEDEDEATAAVSALRARGILVNAVDRPALCDFTLPAIVDRDPVLVAIGTGGVSAGLAATLRQRLEGIIPPGVGRLASGLCAARDRLRHRFPRPEDRRRALTAAMGQGADLDPMAGVVPFMNQLDAPFVVDLILDAVEPRTPGGTGVHSFPLRSGDPDDLTLREARLLAMADRIYHEADVPAAILARARADAPRIMCDTRPVGAMTGVTVYLLMGKTS